MTTAVATNGPQTEAATRPDRVPVLAGPRIPWHPAIEERFGIDKAGWQALVGAIFPTATKLESIVLALSYCRARRLDPFKRNVHIVPIWNQDQGEYVDTIWPGIGELRTTAFRTTEYAGNDEVEFGPDVKQAFEGMVGRKNNKQRVEVTVTFPEWARMTVYRFVKNQKCRFVGPKVFWLETYATRGHDNDVPNEMWQTRPRGQLEKCATAAALRNAFPEEIGSDYIAEEAFISGRPATPIDAEFADAAPKQRGPKPSKLNEPLEPPSPPAGGVSGDRHADPPAQQETEGPTPESMPAERGGHETGGPSPKPAKAKGERPPKVSCSQRNRDLDACKTLDDVDGVMSAVYEEDRYSQTEREKIEELAASRRKNLEG